jgi:hypothetical protein
LTILKLRDGVSGVILASLGILNILFTVWQNLTDLRLEHRFRILLVVCSFRQLLQVRNVVRLALLPLIAEILLLLQIHGSADLVDGAADFLGVVGILGLIGLPMNNCRLR